MRITDIKRTAQYAYLIHGVGHSAVAADDTHGRINWKYRHYYSYVTEISDA